MVSVKNLTGNQVVTIREHGSFHANGFADRAFYRKSPSVNLWCDVFNDDALSSIRW